MSDMTNTSIVHIDPVYEGGEPPDGYVGHVVGLNKFTPATFVSNL